MEKLSHEVNKYMRENEWIPIGGVFFAKNLWCQAAINHNKQ